MGRSRTRKLRPRAPVFPFATTTTDTSSPEEEDTTNLNISIPSSPPVSSLKLSTSPSHEKEDSQAPEDSQTHKETEGIPTALTHHDSVCFLKIIGSIQSGQKLSHSSSNPNQPFSIDPNQWSSSISRWWNGDSRSITVKLLRDKFDAVFRNIDETYSLHMNRTASTAQQAFNRSPKDILLDYARELAVAEKGLRHLCHTYKRDVPIASELQVMLESVSIRKQTIDNMFTIKDD